MKPYIIVMIVISSISFGVVAGASKMEMSKFHFRPSECKITDVLAEDQTLVMQQLTCKHTVVK